MDTTMMAWKMYLSFQVGIISICEISGGVSVVSLVYWLSIGSTRHPGFQSQIKIRLSFPKPENGFLVILVVTRFLRILGGVQ